MAFSRRGRPNVSRLARRGKVDDLRAALRYREEGDAAPDRAVAVRAQAAEALAQFDGATVAGDLATALADPEPEVRLAAIGSLGVVGVHDSEQVERLVGCVVARDDHAPELTAGALKLLVASVPEQTAELLVDRALEPSAPGLDEGHRASLDLLLTTDARGPGARAAVVDMLVSRLEQRPEDGVEARAELMLGWLGDAARERVLHALENGTASPALMHAAGRLGDARAIEPVVKGLQAADASMRQAAAEAARGLNHTRTVPALLKATQDDEQAVRDAASAALDRMGTAAVIAGLAVVVDARGLLEASQEEALTGEVLGAEVARALEEGAAEPGQGEPAQAGPAQGEPRAVARPVPPRRRGGLLDRLFGRPEY